MNQAFKPYIPVELTGTLENDVAAIFRAHGDEETLEHVLKVASEAKRIAGRFGIDARQAEIAALLHDISNVIPVGEMLTVAAQLSIEVATEERLYPHIIHQKLSRTMAACAFGITDRDILSAIECHTTLKPGASQLDKVLFIADKISWDLPGEHSELAAIRTKVEEGQLDEAVLLYLDHVWSQRDQLKLVHEWLIRARAEMKTASEFI